VVESHASGIGWTEPKDLDASQMLFLINGGTGKGGGAQEITSRHMGGASVLFADNEAGFLKDDVPSEYVEAMLTISGKDQVPPEVRGKKEEDLQSP
jgi:prepilin-type processing-associated H-X9-DG protein